MWKSRQSFGLRAAFLFACFTACITIMMSFTQSIDGLRAVSVSETSMLGLYQMMKLNIEHSIFIVDVPLSVRHSCVFQFEFPTSSHPPFILLSSSFHPPVYAYLHTSIRPMEPLHKPLSIRAILRPFHGLLDQAALSSPTRFHYAAYIQRNT